jgi:hypothetical protein
MPDLLRQGVTWLNQMRDTHCASEVVYRRGDETWIAVATLGQTQVEIGADVGATVTSHVRDFLVSASALPLGEPRVGDVIESDVRRYEVIALGDDLRGWRWSDPFRTTYRIHTQDVGPIEEQP